MFVIDIGENYGEVLYKKYKCIKGRCVFEVELKNNSVVDKEFYLKVAGLREGAGGGRFSKRYYSVQYVSLGLIKANEIRSFKGDVLFRDGFKDVLPKHLFFSLIDEGKINSTKIKNSTISLF